MWYEHILQGAFDFAFYYPLFMAYLWMVGGVYYYFHWERKDPGFQSPPELAQYPSVSIIVPCHNEGENLYETIGALESLKYPDYDIIAINDGSTDNTGEILDKLSAQIDKLRVIHLAENQGKAVGLKMGSLMSANEFLVCIDGDAILDENAINWTMRHFNNGPRVGAVTGNPRIRTRSTLLGKIQVGEFSSIIGLIKRAQRVYGRIFTVSGVITTFRKTALHQVGYWSTDMVTEDIDISWKLQMAHYDIRYEPNCLCWILMPETLRGLWQQRVRWAQGGAEVLLKYFTALFNLRKRRMWLVYLELLISIIWAYIIFAVAGLWLVGQFVSLPDALVIRSLLPGWTGVALGFTCLLQFAISLKIDSRYEPNMMRYYYWMIWYPMAFWIISACTSIAGLLKAVTKTRGKRAVWVSPDRGLREGSA